MDDLTAIRTAIFDKLADKERVHLKVQSGGGRPYFDISFISTMTHDSTFDPKAVKFNEKSKVLRIPILRERVEMAHRMESLPCVKSELSFSNVLRYRWIFEDLKDAGSEKFWVYSVSLVNGDQMSRRPMRAIIDGGKWRLVVYLKTWESQITLRDLKV